MPFTNKTVLITGAGSGIGRAAAETFAQQGAQVAVADIHQRNADETVSAIRQAGGTATAFVSDVSQSAAVATMVAAVRQTYGAIHVLVNNAGIALPSMSIVDVDAVTWQRVLQANLKSILFCCQAVVPQMIAAGSGRIVSTASTAAKVPRWEIGPYCGLESSSPALYSLSGDGAGAVPDYGECCRSRGYYYQPAPEFWCA